MSIATHPRVLEVPQQATVECSHCRLPVPSGLIQPQASDQFCCHGCETAFAVMKIGLVPVVLPQEQNNNLLILNQPTVAR